MKIALVTDKLAMGGGAEHIYQIAKEMRDFHFGIFALDGNVRNRFELLKNVTIVMDNSFQAITKFQADLIHFHHLRPLFDCIGFGKKFNAPVFFTANGLHIRQYDYKKGTKNRIARFLRHHLEKFLLNKVSKVIVVSNEDETFVRKKYNIRRSCIIRYGISTKEIEAITDAKKILRKDLKLPQDRFLCVIPARFCFQKGLDILIKAIHLGDRAFRAKNMMFLLAGDGEEFENVKDLSSRLGISDDIVFMGRRNDVYKIMKACDLLILPSRWEGLPITLVEAGFCKIPVIASDTCGNREIVKHEERGLLFRNLDHEALTDILQRAVEGKWDLSVLAENMHDYVQSKHTIAHMIEALEREYQRAFQSIL